jgi:hypothetical protein
MKQTEEKYEGKGRGKKLETENQRFKSWHLFIDKT